MQATRLIQPARTYLTGFAHRATHEAWLHLCKAIEAGRGPTLANGSTSQGFIKAHQYEKGERTFADDDLEAYTQSAFEEMGAWEGALGESIWVRPSFDGLKITLPARGPVRDDEDA